MNQKQKFGFFLTVLVALPIFSLGLFGLNTIRTELVTYQLQEQQDAANRMTALTSLISKELTRIQPPLQKLVAVIHKQKGDWALRCTFQKLCPQYEGQGLDLIISFDDEGEQIYPPSEVTGQLYPENQALRKMSSALSTARQALDDKPVEKKREGVWATFISPEGHKLIYCWRNKVDYTYCAAIDREWLIDRITKVLQQGMVEKDNHIYRLLNVSDQVIWQSADTEKSNLTAQKQLANPLYFWRLEVWQPEKLAERSYPFTILALTLPLIALLISIGFMLFKTQNEALALADKRTAIAASVSHELRTPLANLQLYASLILSKTAKSKSQTNNDITKFANIISAETTRLSELVDNALTVTAGKHPASNQKTVIIPDHIITETISHLSPLLGADLKLITLDLSAAKPVLMDRSALEQILVNLIDNARKYAKGKRINIRSKFVKNTLKLTVRDWGPDFKSQKLSNLFTPFYQSDQNPSNNLEDKGFGLGLAVCKQLAEANNGSITCESANPGARFIVILEVEKNEQKNNKKIEEEPTCIS